MPDNTDDVSMRAERLAASVPRGVSTRELFVARAENAELWDMEGRRFIDFSAGIGVLNTGHRHHGSGRAANGMFHSYVLPRRRLRFLCAPCGRLHQLTPGTFGKKTLFVTTEAEATENAIKIGRSATRRRAVVAFAGGFHGRTLLAMALTGKVHPYKRGFGPFPADVYHVPFPSPYGRITTQHALGELDRLFHADVDPSDVAVARTGKMFGIEHADVVPDLITMAKGLGGGFSIAAVSGRDSIMDAAHAGGSGGTFAGSPIGIALLTQFSTWSPKKHSAHGRSRSGTPFASAWKPWRPAFRRPAIFGGLEQCKQSNS